MDNIILIRLLKQSDASSVFEALLNDKTCILKVVGFFFPLIQSFANRITSITLWSKGTST